MRILVSLFRKRKIAKKTKDAAKNRLLLALAYDREDKKTAIVKNLKTDLSALFDGYDEVDPEMVEYNLCFDKNIPSLNINIPIRRTI